MTERCAYCGHPKHAGGETAEISAARAAELWANRGLQHRLQPTAAECETIKQLWELMPNGGSSYQSTFKAMRIAGSYPLRVVLGRRARLSLDDAFARLLNTECPTEHNDGPCQLTLPGHICRYHREAKTRIDDEMREDGVLS